MHWPQIAVAVLCPHISPLLRASEFGHKLFTMKLLASVRRCAIKLNYGAWSAGLLPKQAGWTSSADAADITGQMIAFARSQSKDNPEQAIDVLRSGLSMQPGQDEGLAAGRLQLCIAEQMGERAVWHEATAAADKAVKAALNDSQCMHMPASQVALHGTFLSAQALVASNQAAIAEDKACATCDTFRQRMEAETSDLTTWWGYIRSLGLKLSVQVASSNRTGADASASSLMQAMQQTGAAASQPAVDNETATAQVLTQAAEQSTAAAPPQPGVHNPAVAAALLEVPGTSPASRKAIGDWQFLRRNLQAAREQYEAAAMEAAAARQHCASDEAAVIPASHYTEVIERVT